MLAYPIKNALESRLFDRVIVSTEDKEIREVASESGAEVMHRPESLAGDRSRVVQVCKHVLDVLKEQGTCPEFFCCIYATAILITSQDLKDSFQLFYEEPIPDVVMGVTEFNLPPVQALEGKDGFLTPKWPEYLSLQSQFHPHLVASNGTLYWARTSSFEQNPSFYCQKLKGYTIPRIRAIDLDTPEDLEFALIVAEKTLSKRTQLISNSD